MVTAEGNRGTQQALQMVMIDDGRQGGEQHYYMEVLMMDISNGFIAIILAKQDARTRATKLKTTELLTLTGLSDARTLQKLISEERENAPICSDKGGYYLPDIGTPAGQRELNTCIATLTRRGGNTIKTAKKLEKFVDPQLDGQEAIEGMK